MKTKQSKHTPLTKHTPGPWIIDRDKYLVSRASSVIVGHVADAIEADARLIATAPDLLRELKSAIFYIETYGGEVTKNFAAGENLEVIKRIIAKAEGKE